MILMFSGPSTIGKDSTWIRIAEDCSFKKITPYTTRPIRQNEVNGDDYHFLTHNQFQDGIKTNSFLEWDYFNNNYYGTGIEILEQPKNKNYVFHVLARMSMRLKEKLTNVKTIILLPSNEQILIDRLRQRGYDENEIRARYNHYLEEKAHASLFDFIIPDAELLTDFEAMQIILKITEQQR